jgi:hypothetical protein
VRKILSPQRLLERPAQGMQYDIGIRVAFEPARIGNENASKHQFAVCVAREAMRILPKPHPEHW